MKQRFFTSGLVFLLLLSVCIFAGCKDDDDNNNNSNGPDLSCWPDNLPNFEYGELFSIICEDGMAAVFHQITNPETTYNSYKTTLIDDGWVFEEDTSNEYNWAGAYGKGLNWVQVIVSKVDEVAQIYYGTHVE